MNVPPSQYAMKQGKIQGHHRDRLAVVYVRQSTMQQMERHQESTKLQYGLAERAQQMGWANQRVQVIDSDLGKSGASVEGRLGFQQLLAEVAMNHVGIVLGLDMSRLARSCKDWHHLLEVCALFRTLIADLDGVYDPSDYNDRLLLGLKGTMSEAELHIIKQRMLAGKLAKARRGELGVLVPYGYVRKPSGEVTKDPDEQAQQTIQLIFTQFEKLGTMRGVLKFLVDNGIKLPYRLASGQNKGDLEWHRPVQGTLHSLLHNPIYAGAYAYGRRPADPRKQKPGRPFTGKIVAKMDQWQVLLKDHLPAYITWERYEQNVKQMSNNQNIALGVVRNGSALLSRLIFCGRCGKRMLTDYPSNKNKMRYACTNNRINYAGKLCQSFSGEALDDLIADMVLQALEPAALEISLKVAEDLNTEREQLHQQWKQRLERAHYQVTRAFRQYNAVEPENRLVARTLERECENALMEEDRIKTEYTRFQEKQPIALSAREREAIHRLSHDIPALWHSPQTSQADRQAVIRQLVDHLVVTVQGNTECVDVQIHWIGGNITETAMVRPIKCIENLSYYPQLLNRIATLRGEGHFTKNIAQILNAEGWRSANRNSEFSGGMVYAIIQKGLRSMKSPLAIEVEKNADEWTTDELSAKLDVSYSTIYHWLRQGKMTARVAIGLSRRIWLVHADEEEIRRLQTLASNIHERRVARIH
ncbi:MAG: recombinase family protein [Magnetococcales bacterium]|nr:recombinase family protein [Magnetococcales bacterium]MBF0115304.1 recombinase family protein [Magnetococcales bacterium]